MKHIALALLLTCTLQLYTIGQQKVSSVLSAEKTTDAIAERVLKYQLSNGGWPKQLKNKTVVDYSKVIDEDLAIQIEQTDSLAATIDNKATTREIHILLSAYQETANIAYLNAAERGIRYLLESQYQNGGFPQFYPDSSSYRAQITYNDNAMINTLEILLATSDAKEEFAPIQTDIQSRSKEAVRKGIACILATQIVQADSLTIWAAQYDPHTLQPAVARAYEPAALATSESVGVVRFLMKLPHDKRVEEAIHAALRWFEAHDIEGYRFDTYRDEHTGKTSRKLVEDPNVNSWARFYDIQTNRPVFGDRDHSITYSFEEVSEERQHGYAWFGTWPQKLIEKDYPKWKKGINKRTK